jgi:hypothetical protein
MKYKLGDKVRIKSLDWYNQNKDENGFVHCGNRIFDNYMSVFCGSVVTICGEYSYYCGYDVREDMQCRTWTDDMFEGLADAEPQEKMVSLEQVCEWLRNNIDFYVETKYDEDFRVDIEQLLNDIRKAMEE